MNVFCLNLLEKKEVYLFTIHEKEINYHYLIFILIIIKKKKIIIINYMFNLTFLLPSLSF